MVKLYSTHCARCRVIELKLKQKNIAFEIIDDEKEVVKVGKEHNITSAPILEIEDNFLDFNQTVAFLATHQ